MACHLTHTTAATHALIEANLAETPVYGGWMDAAGPRYCPSIEDKVVRFADKASHQARVHPTRVFFWPSRQGMGAGAATDEYAVHSVAACMMLLRSHCIIPDFACLHYMYSI